MVEWRHAILQPTSKAKMCPTSLYKLCDIIHLSKYSDLNIVARKNGSDLHILGYIFLTKVPQKFWIYKTTYFYY
jgi:hypothetical protein